MNIVFLICIFSYALFSFILAWALLKKEHQNDIVQPFISIIIAVKNEAVTLEKCIQSLVSLNYPVEKMEIILVDDDSKDQSAQIISKYTKVHPHIKYIYLESKNKKRPGKAGVLLEGIDQSHGEFLFFTDADCSVPENWITTLLQRFSPQTGLVGGYTLLDKKHDRLSISGKIQSMDQLFLVSVAAACGILGKPASWMGNNLALRRSVYEQVGGFRKLGFSLVEDFALIDALNKQKKWKINFTTSPSAVVKSQPVSTITGFYQQRKRWYIGAKAARPFAKSLMGICILSHLIIMTGWLFLPLQLYFAGLLIKIVSDFLVVLPVVKKFDRFDLLKYFLPFQILYFGYSVFFPVLFLFDSKVKWKGEQFVVETMNFRA